MRHALATTLCATLLGLATGVSSAQPLRVTFGTSWDGPTTTLQSIVDARYGAGNIDVETDYLGARAGEPDPFFWLGERVTALLVREIAGNATRNVLGWYLENGSFPVINGVGDGIVFDGTDGDGAMTVVFFPHHLERFGFYMDPNGDQSVRHAPQPELFFTNRTFNDHGPDGGGALHVPTGGDAQALVFDIARWTQPNTWLVCFEDIDSGSIPSPCCGETDNDFNDLVFEVHALGATPALPLTFGALKVRYR